MTALLFETLLSSITSTWLFLFEIQFHSGVKLFYSVQTSLTDIWLDLLLKAVAECLVEIIFFFWTVYDYFQHTIENNIKKLKIKIFICRYNNLKCHYIFWWFYSSGQHDYHLQCVTLNKAIINITCCKTLDNSK